MKILIDIGHPAHVHLFRHFAQEMTKKGHKFLFTTREKEVAVHLLKHFGFDFVSFGKPYKSLPGKLFGLVKFNLKLLKVSMRFKPDLFISAGSFYASHISFLMHKPHITFEDTGNMEQVKLYLPFSEVILVPKAFHKDLGPKQIRYSGYHELAYLHPNQFKPNSDILKQLCVEKDETYIVIRFVSWNASHDAGQVGFSLERKIELVQKISKYGKVFISSEGDLPAELEQFRVGISPEYIHDAMAFASLYIGEGATMASECAALGTPAIYVNSITAGTLEEQENYGLLYGFRSSDGVIEKALEILKNPEEKKKWKSRQKKMLSEKIDVTAFMVWFVENYPESKDIMKKDPDYQDRFKDKK